ncbi:uncharacterized protein LAESUDRAFT_732220 [Laetiporus sulphureus 93-53]|uniref:RRM domain-containing protein n=1 Tax=Laetiporus sulphureus 93-53 TaxID=1314785 RepID=A0A165B9F9_9APHY|nr:uncharacterized protein LAESUDRAFT_732220 [Laetiporus sulphureus 93-53]KZT00552.1 hypothetical protein LAESUDRAFT_732220 [Laetiporus sulphureus 93-53]
MTASLLERLSLPNNNSVGPVRTRGNRAGSASPYNRNQRPPKGDINNTWRHDLYRGPGADKDQTGSLSARLSDSQSGAPKMNFSGADRALREALGEKGLSIKGASNRGNVVQVGGLAPGTSAADVEAIFKRCGAITNAVLYSRGDPPIVRVTFKFEKDAQAAVAKFHGQPADGRLLEVKIIGGVNATLGGRIMGAAIEEDSVDVLMEDGSSGGSKLRSDDILAKGARATVLIAPPGMEPSDYTQRWARGGRGRGRGRGGRRGGGGGRGSQGAAGRMDVE